MSKRHPLDQLFHDQLADSSAAVPDDMWDRIQKKRQPKRRPPYGRWLGAALLLLVTSGAFVYWMQTNHSSPELGHFPTDTEKATNNTNAAVEVLTPVVSQETLVTTNTAETTANISTDIETDEVVLSTTSTPATTTSSATNRRPRNSATLQNTIEESTSTFDYSPTEKSKTEAISTEKSAVTVDSPVATSTPSIETESLRAAGPHQRRFLQQTAQLPRRFYEPTSAEKIKLFANHAPRCAKFSGALLHLDAELLGGPGYAHSQLTAKTGEATSHLDQRLASESPLISYTTSMRLAATTKSGLGMRSGLAFTQINDRFEHNVGSSMNVEVIFGPDGEVLGRDTTYTESYIETSKNRLRFVEIPLLLGYEKQMGKLRIGAQAGAYLGLFFNAQGTTFSPATAEPIPYGQEGEPNVLPIYKKRATAAWYGSITVAYNLASRYSIVAEPYFKTYPRALSTDGYDLEQNYWMTGLQLGLRMRL